MFENTSDTYLDLVGSPTRVHILAPTQILFFKDRLGNQFLQISQHGKPQAVFPATDRNIEVILSAGLRIHEYLMFDGEIDYREIEESRDYFKSETHGGAFPAAPDRAPGYRHSHMSSTPRPSQPREAVA
ncbi:hypothetical protein LMG28688_05635 [Paraburkholderia caffeinitolerans]|uniref:Uncharacterized protein n=2 Tax=Paraburkholderia caffeinitolerans TaxID=1723730 RepID=A0A6J5GKI3_9BURK|nr:hypothetical protein [Paraburkholderia caffeinitolerans]CAB3802771.1 hypothetical protein LMG28688_05635 [Paraburkholderia caffeinitolerans]